MAIFGRVILAIALLIAQQLANVAIAQDYPSKTIRIVNGASPEIIPRIFLRLRKAAWQSSSLPHGAVFLCRRVYRGPSLSGWQPRLQRQVSPRS